MKKIRLKAMAKINLGLDVVRKREDGYHEVRMIMQTIRMYDQIELEPTEAPGIRVSTNLNYLPTNEDNLVYKAAKLLMDEFDVKKGLNIGLRKFIPVAAGRRAEAQMRLRHGGCEPPLSSESFPEGADGAGREDRRRRSILYTQRNGSCRGDR